MGQPLPDLPRIVGGIDRHYIEAFITEHGPSTIHAIAPNADRAEVARLQTLLRSNSMFKQVGNEMGPSGKTRAVYGLRGKQHGNAFTGFTREKQ